MAYAKQLTRDYLEYLGVTKVTEDGHIFKGDKEAHQLYDGNYLLVQFYDPALRKLVPLEERTTGTGEFTINVQRIVYTWFNRIIPEGMVIDYIDNNKTNNHITNLRLLTPKENIYKERPCDIKEIPCVLSRPRSWYEERLNKYIAVYEEAKANKNAKEAHKQRTNIANIRARLRYYDNNIDSYLSFKGDNSKMTEKQLKRENRAKLEAIIIYAKYHLDASTWHNRVALRKTIDEPATIELVNKIYNLEIEENK